MFLRNKNIEQLNFFIVVLIELYDRREKQRLVEKIFEEEIIRK